MNAKKAKALRKLVRNLQEQQGELPKHDFVTVKNTEKSVMVQVVDELQTEATAETPIEAPELSIKQPGRVEKVTYFSGQQRVAPRSQRAIYLHLKKELEKVEAQRLQK